MVEEESGAFWDQTIYSPYDSKKKAKLKLPLKKGLDPKIYGSYSREQFAYFFIYRAIKKKKEVLEFAPVPCSIAKQIEQSKGALDEYAKTLAYEAGEEFVCVERTKIYKQQLIEFGGSRFYLTGKREIRNATQVSFNNEEIKVFSDLVDGEEVSQDKCLDLFNGVVKSVCERSPKVALNIKLASWCNSFASLSSEEQKQVLLAVVDLANGKRNMVDLTAVGGSKNTGCLNPTFSRILSLEGGIDFIDQSVTGMFEKVTHIGL
jgi:CRISPR-associated endonuclease Csn1